MVEAVLSLTIPLLGTTLGAALVFLVRDKLPVRLEKVLLGFAGGIMTAAIFFSLLMPSIESSANLGNLSFLPPVIGFVLGVALIFLLDKLIPHLHSKINRVEGRPSHLKKGTLMFLAVTLHNIPEGLTVGVAVAAILYPSRARGVDAVSGVSARDWDRASKLPRRPHRHFTFKR